MEPVLLIMPGEGWSLYSVHSKFFVLLRNLETVMGGMISLPFCRFGV